MAPDCVGLAEELGPDAVPAMEIGGGCTLEVRSHTTLDRVRVQSSCPEDASILVPFERTSAGWVLDDRQLREIDNGDCLNGG